MHAALNRKPITEEAPVTEAATVHVRGQKAPGAFRTISEVAEDLGVQQHVLRFWETRFFQVRPLKRGGGRRYYRPEDVALLKKIHHLLYAEGYTIKGVQKLLKSGLKAHDLPVEVPAAAPQAPANEPVSAKPAVALTPEKRKELEATLAELKALREILAA